MHDWTEKNFVRPFRPYLGKSINTGDVDSTDLRCRSGLIVKKIVTLVLPQQVPRTEGPTRDLQVHSGTWLDLRSVEDEGAEFR